MVTGHSVPAGRYTREESEAQKLDRNWSELVQELRVIGIGVQILFAFLLSIAFQARFAKTSPAQRDIYLVTLAFSGLATALLISPAAMHRILFRIGVKDELVTLTNWLAVAGLAVLSVSMTGAIVLTADWVAGSEGAIVCGVGAALVFSIAWFAVPIWIRRRHEDHDRRNPPISSVREVPQTGQPS
jgi:hypothetical protein